MVIKYVMGVIAVIVVVACVAMVFRKKNVLCSRMEGTIIDKESRPVAAVRVVREWKWAWNDSTGSDETKTDSQGRFAFAQVTGRSFAADLLPHEVMITQRYTAHGAAGPVEILLLMKGNYDDNGENDGKPLNVVCQIDRERGAVGRFLGTVVEIR